MAVNTDTVKVKIDSDLALQKAIVTCLAAGGKHWVPTQIYKVLLLEFGYSPEDFSLGQVGRWLRHFRQEHPQQWSMYINAQQARGTVPPAFGSRSQEITRPNQVWELGSVIN